MIDWAGQAFAIHGDQLRSAATILLAALVTYGLRLGGLLLSERLPNAPAFKRFMDALPGAVLVSLVSPGILEEGFWGLISVAGIVLVFRLTKNLFLAMLTGVVIVALARGWT